MKRIWTLIFIGAMSFSATACNSQVTNNQNSPAESTIFGVTTESQFDTEEVEPSSEAIAAEAPTEDIQETANQAYLHYLQDHSDWFLIKESTFAYAMKNRPIAFWDLNSDGVEEMIHFRPNIEDKRGELNLCIVTYDKGTKILLDDFIVSLPGAEAGYSVFVGNDNNVYSVMAKECNGSVNRYDYDGSDISVAYLADAKAKHLEEPKDAICHVNDSLVTFDEFNSYRSDIEDKVKTYILINHQNSRGVEDISMSFDEACEHLK